MLQFLIFAANVSFPYSNQGDKENISSQISKKSILGTKYKARLSVCILNGKYTAERLPLNTHTQSLSHNTEIKRGQEADVKHR